MGKGGGCVGTPPNRHSGVDPFNPFEPLSRDLIVALRTSQVWSGTLMLLRKVSSLISSRGSTADAMELAWVEPPASPMFSGARVLMTVLFLLSAPRYTSHFSSLSLPTESCPPLYLTWHIARRSLELPLVTNSYFYIEISTLPQRHHGCQPYG